MKKKLLLFFACCLSVLCAKADDNSEKLLVNENFQSWQALASSSTETEVIKSTDFSNEPLVYKLSEIQVSPAGWDENRFDPKVLSKGYLMAAKSATPYIELSPLASVTRVEFTHGATGGNRGYQLWKKVGDGDWVSVSSSVANPSQGVRVSVDINEQNVALKFTNLTSSQNAYLFDLQIYGNYTSSHPQVNLDASVNIDGAGTITRSLNSETYDKDATLTLTATANFGYKFVKWVDGNDNTLSTNKSFDIVLNEDKTVKAIYEALTAYALNLKIEGSQWGEVVLNPQPTDGKYEAGTLVTATVVPNQATVFSYWEDQTSDQSRTIQINDDTDLVATFDEIPFIVGWDFKKQDPKIARKGDFYSETSNTGIINLHKPDGSAINWLANTGSFSPNYTCVRKWATDFVNEQRYFQANFSTLGYHNIEVKSMLGGNYRMYAKQKMQYSIDGVNFIDLKTVDLESAYNSTWVECNSTLPAEAENIEKIYIRWTADETSKVLGDGNDGTALTNVFVFADKEVSLDPPVLVATTPAEGSASASVKGSIVLTFNKKVQAGSGNITLNGETLTGIFGSKTATFKYSGLEYNSNYSLVIPEGALQDMSGNIYEGMTLNFSTMNRPQPIAKVFDAIVATDGSGDYTTIQAAIDAVPDNNSLPFLIYVKNGTYKGHVDIPATKPFIRLIGQDWDKVIITDDRLSGDKGDGTPVYHVSLGATVVVNAANCYFENITFDNSWGYENRQGPQALAMFANNDKIVFKNCKMRSYQDTYLTSTKNISDRQYLEKCYIEGAVDYIYGGGDVFFEECTLFNTRPAGGYIVAPSHKVGTQWGYIFNNCVLDGDAGTIVYLGRPWQTSPKTVFLNTLSKIDIYPSGWYYKMGAIPAVFADYGTMDAQGNPMDLSQRIEDYEYDIKEGNVVTETIKGKAKKSLTDEEAAQYTLSNSMKGTDDWDPRTITEATQAPVLTYNGQLSWNAVNYAICYVILKDGVAIGFTSNNFYNLSDKSIDLENSSFQVQSVSEHGALSELSNTVIAEGLSIDNQKSNDINYEVKDGYLYINDLAKDSRVEIYSISGTKLKGELTSDSFVAPINTTCIVRIISDKNITTFKVVSRR